MGFEGGGGGMGNVRLIRCVNQNAALQADEAPDFCVGSELAS